MNENFFKINLSLYLLYIEVKYIFYCWQESELKSWRVTFKHCELVILQLQVQHMIASEAWAQPSKVGKPATTCGRGKSSAEKPLDKTALSAPKSQSLTQPISLEFERTNAIFDKPAPERRKTTSFIILTPSLSLSILLSSLQQSRSIISIDTQRINFHVRWPFIQQ